MIENQGEINPEMIILMGASTKRDDNSKIGTYGTGFNYALATCMRNDYPVLIYTGKSSVTAFTTKPIEARNITFNQILTKIDNKPWKETSLTTEMGPKWEVHHAIREFVSNAIDEDDFIVVEVNESKLKGRAGYTRIFVPNVGEVKSFHKNLKKYFLYFRESLHRCYNGRVFESYGSGCRIYKSGVLVYENVTLPAAYDYELPHISIGENRLADLSTIIFWLGDLLSSLPTEYTESAIKMLTTKDTLEYKAGSGPFTLSERWKKSFPEDVIIATKDLASIHEKQLKDENVMIVSEDWYSKLEEAMVKTVKNILTPAQERGYNIVEEQDNENKKILSKIISFFKRRGHNIAKTNINIFVADSNKPCRDYDVIDNDIYINYKVFRKRPNEIAITILKAILQYESSRECSADEWDGLEDYAIKKLMNSYERAAKRPLFKEE